MKTALAALCCAFVASFYLGPVAFVLAAAAVVIVVGFRPLLVPPLLAIALTMVALSTAAFADGSSSIPIGDIWTGIVPYITAAVGAVITFLGGWVVVLLKTKLGLSIDDSMRASLQTAATNAAGLVLGKLGNTLQGKSIDVGSPLIAEAVTYVLKAAPGAIAHFGLTPEAIAEKILALLPQVANTTVTATTLGK